METRSTVGCHYFPKWVTGLWLLLGLAALMLSGACRRGVPAVDFNPKPASAQDTITGIVRGPEGTAPVVARTVEVVNVATGERRSVQTASNGGFTIQVPAGKYRLDVALRDGETLVKRPDIVDMDRGDVDSHIEFVLGPARISRPRGPGYRVDNGLGSPVA